MKSLSILSGLLVRQKTSVSMLLACVLALALLGFSNPALAGRSILAAPGAEDGTKQADEPVSPSGPNAIAMPNGGTCSGCASIAWSVTNTGTGRAGFYFLNNTSSANPALEARTYSQHGAAVGVLGTVRTFNAGKDSAGVRGRNYGTGGYGFGVWGSHDGAGPGVKGTSANGFGGEFTSNNYRGAYVRGGPSWIALYADGWTYINGNLDVTANAYISGDLDVGGDCIGCTDTYPARNIDSASLALGDLVAAAGVEADPQTGQPVLLVRKAGKPGDVVIGVAGKVLVRDTAGERAKHSKQPLKTTAGVATQNAYVQVIVGGLAQVRVTAPDIKIGDPLALGTTGGASRAVAQAAFARAVSAPDAQGLVWALVSADY